MTLSLDTAYRSFGGEVEASSTPTICRPPDSRRHQFWAIAPGEITQLRGSDIQKRGTDYFAKLSPSAGKMKTRTARTVAIHEHLVQQGFITFVEEMGSGPLFY